VQVFVNTLSSKLILFMNKSFLKIVSIQFVVAPHIDANASTALTTISGIFANENVNLN